MTNLGQVKLITSLAGLLKKSGAGRGFFYLLFMTKNINAALILPSVLVQFALTFS